MNTCTSATTPLPSGNSSLKSRGSTPTIVKSFPFNRAVCPIMPGFAPNSRRHSPSVRIISGAAPRRSSPGAKKRPNCGFSASSGRKFAVVKASRTCSGSAVPVMVPVVAQIPPISSNARERLRNSIISGPEAGPRVSFPQVDQRMVSRFAWG